MRVCGYYSRITVKRARKQNSQKRGKRYDTLYLFNNHQMITKIINLISLAGWVFLLVHVGMQLFLDPLAFRTANLDLDIQVLRIVQALQAFDILFILAGWSKGSLLGSLAQVSGRLVVTYVYVEQETDRLYFAIIIIMWSIADANRYLYYLFKTPITTFLRYNSFLVLYPIGAFGEVMVLNDYLKRHVETLTNEQIYLTRAMQVIIPIGVLLIFSYLLQSRKKQAANNYGIGASTTEG
jgi:very-long-chain (3R)-3-hydroxyacyl-CoA dehydratase